MYSRSLSARLLSITAALAIALGATSCASSNTSDGPTAGGRGGTLNVALDKAPASLDPADMEQSTSPFAQPAYDALIGVDANGSLVPALATEWGFTDDENKVFEITVRDDVTFSDGAELDADALVTNLKHLDGGKSNVASLVNGGTYEKVDDDTVRITWTTPHPLAPQALTQRWVAGMVVSPKAIEDDPKALATKTVGAGPYELDADRTVAGSTYVYKARDDYWNPDAQHWDEIVITVIANPEQRLNALKTGEVDYVAGDLSTADAAGSAGMQVLYAPTIVYGLSLLDRDGTLGSPLKDVRVRQAINYALDRESIATALLGDYGFATEQTVVPSEAGYVKALKGTYAYDPDKAKSLLAEAGYSNGFSLKVVASTSATAATLSQVLVEQLAKVGITIELDSRPSADYFEGMTGGTFPAAVIGYGSQPLPMEYDGLFGPKAIFNPLGSTSEVIEKTMGEALVAPADEATRLYEGVVTELVEQAWFAPAVFAPVFYFASTDLAPVSVTEARPQSPITELAPAA
ncbi:ABC transporter substrate-binding protein [Propionicicella superfundia]|uniref:ABC transporter substrate-binding protein n=1 Tax=Propionicicella superfundia TaxID=348582 RepID=UPI000400CAE2|nr:ABC transporter substrate-binding protein [Propionicicella superfundia]